MFLTKLSLPPPPPPLLSIKAGGEFAYLFPSTANSLNKLIPLTPVFNTLAASAGVGYMNNNSSTEVRVSRVEGVGNGVRV
jgi:hypothetical protein